MAEICDYQKFNTKILNTYLFFSNFVNRFKNPNINHNISIMTKAEIAKEIAKSTGIDYTSVINVIEQFMTVVKDSLAHGENVYLRGFGSFVTKERAEKVGRNITANTSVVIPAHKVPSFKPSDEFKNSVK
jgi:DNA-binding protein HU-beta